MEFGSLGVKEVQGILRYRPSAERWTVRGRKNHIVGIILHGKALHDFGYQTFTLSQNCIYFLNQKDDYDVRLLSPTSESFSFHFTSESPVETDSFCLSIQNPAPFLSLLEKAEKAHHTNKRLLLFSYLYQFCSLMEEAKSRRYSQKDQRMQKAKEYMDLHFAEADCLARAIGETGLTSRRFGDLFRGEFDLTPNRYLTFRKIEYAKSLLSTKALSVTDVATLCGFSDLYYFSKVFKSITGTSPGKWER